MDDFTFVVLVATGAGCAAFLVWDLWWRDEDMEPEDGAVVGPFGPVPPPAVRPPVGFHHSRVVGGVRRWPWDDDGPDIADVALGVAAAMDFNDDPEPRGLSDYEPPAPPEIAVWTHHETGEAMESSVSDYSSSSGSCDSSDSGSSSSDSGSCSGGD